MPTMASARPSRTACCASAHVGWASTRIFTPLARANRATASMPPPVSVLPDLHATGGYDGCPVSTRVEQVAGFGFVVEVEEQPTADADSSAARTNATGDFIA